MKKEILLNPGPVNLSQGVRKALLRPDLCHREPEFIKLQNSIRTDLLQIYKLSQKNWAAVLLTGSGTSAMEAMLTSMVPDRGHVLIIENGVYGERMTRIAELYHINHTRLHHAWDAPIDLKALEKIINQNVFSHVAVIHHETTTGRLNNLHAIAKICYGKNIPLLVDGVSSFGAETIKFRQWNIAACAATANKCLHGVAGTSFVVVNRNAFTKSSVTPRTLYLDLKKYLQQQDAGGTPFTQSVQCFYALDEALKEFKKQGGWKQRQKQYLQNMKIIRDGLIKLGIQPLIGAKDCSCVLHAWHLPKGISYTKLHDALKKQGFVIYAGQGDLAKTMFRVSAMGAITKADMQRFVKVMGKIVKK
jgi:2-aminoethylphosphonate-pyruvate transaminase